MLKRNIWREMKKNKAQNKILKIFKNIKKLSDKIVLFIPILESH